MGRVEKLMRVLRLLALAVGFAAFAPNLSISVPGPQIASVGIAHAQAADAPTDLKSTYTSKLCEVYNTGKQLVYIGLGIGILVVVVLSIGSRFRTGLFVTLVASVVIVATTDKLMTFLVGENTLTCTTK